MAFRLLIDECFDARIVRSLSGDEFDMLSVADAAPGFADPDVAGLARSTDRILMTADKGFGDLVIVHGVRLPELILDRTNSWQAGFRRTRQAIPHALEAIVVLEDDRIRVKTLPEAYTP